MRGIVVACLFVVFAVGFAPANAESIFDKINNMEIFTLKKSSLGCPLPLVGTTCPEDTVFYYFACCTQVESNTGFNVPLKDCCIKPQQWVIAIFFIILVLAVCGIVVNLCRCILGRR